MSSLYQSPVEVQQETNRRTKGGTHFGADWFTDRVSEGIKWNENEGRYDSTGAAWWLGGLVTPEGRKAIEEGKTKKREAEKIESTIESAPGLTEEQIRAQLNGKPLTGKNVKGVVAEAIRDRQQEETPGQIADRQEVVASRQASNQIQRESMVQSANQFNATMQRQLAQDAKNYQLQLQQMADTRDMNAQTLALQQQQMVREDQRYNERMEELDRRDRKQGRQSLIAGLAALGAAFAL